MFKKSIICTATLLLIFLAKISFAQTVSVSGEVLTPLNLKKEDFASYKSVTQTIRDRDGKEHAFKGVALIEILEKAGVTTGAKLRGENLTKIVLIIAADGYEVAYSLAEIDPEFAASTVLLVFQKDGNPLPGDEGPFRIIAPGDRKPARWIREVREIKVLFVKE